MNDTPQNPLGIPSSKYLPGLPVLGKFLGHTAALAGWIADDPEARASWLSDCIRVHALGHWSECDLDDEDKASNESALRTGARILTAHKHPELEDVRIYIISDALSEDGSRATTIAMFPADY